MDKSHEMEADCFWAVQQFDHEEAVNTSVELDGREWSAWVTIVPDEHLQRISASQN